MEMIQEAHQSSGGNFAICYVRCFLLHFFCSTTTCHHPHPRPNHHSSPHQKNTATDQVHPVSPSIPDITRHPRTAYSLPSSLVQSAWLVQTVPSLGSVKSTSRISLLAFCSDVQSPHIWLGKKHIASHSRTQTLAWQKHGFCFITHSILCVCVYVVCEPQGAVSHLSGQCRAVLGPMHSPGRRRDN